MKHLKEHWLPYALAVVIVVVILHDLSLKDHGKQDIFSTQEISLVPDINELSNSEANNLIRYGKTLIDSTGKYLGPHGIVASISNGMNCQNCHRESGTKLYTNNFLLVASTYPKFRERSGKIESVEWRVNECMQRSLNGEALDSVSKEMRAMVAYIKWIGKNVNKNKKEEAAGTKELAFLARAANPLQGAGIYTLKCAACHGQGGAGVLNFDSADYKYPPLWGEHSYAISAGMYRLSKLASFIKHNMPFGATYTAPLLTDDEAWDLAAFINSQPHPKKTFTSDWPVIRSKPVDYPFGPYADAFNEKQHKYGPYAPIQKAKDMAMARNTIK
jgi:thiosulfate dehydrogenase